MTDAVCKDSVPERHTYRAQPPSSRTQIASTVIQEVSSSAAGTHVAWFPDMVVVAPVPIPVLLVCRGERQYRIENLRHYLLVAHSRLNWEESHCGF